MVLKSTFSDVELPKVAIAQYALEQMQTFGDSVAMIDPQVDQTWTFSQLYEESIKFALKLHSIGVQKGDVVGLLVDFHPKYFSLELAVILCKATLAACYIKATSKDIAKQLRLVKAKYCVCSKNELKRELVTQLEEANILDFEDVVNAEVSPEKNTYADILSFNDVDLVQDPIFVAFTSGSTGEPKAIVSTNANFAQCIAVPKVALGLKPDNCMITVCKQLHMFGFRSFFSYLLVGVRHIVTTHLPPELFSKCVSRYGANGALISDFLTFQRLVDEAKLEKNHTLRFIIPGGAHTPKELLQKASKKFNVVVNSGYGCSEGGLISCSAVKQTPFDSVGILCPNVQLKVIDVENGLELDCGRYGELCVKIQSVFQGYLGNKEATEAVLDESGWLKTGDLGYYDKNGVIYVIDRLKSMIKSHGNMAVFPSQLEAVLLSHPSVAEAVVVRTTHPVYNEAPKAFVVKKDESLTMEQLLKFYNTQVAEYQQLFGGLEFIDHIPKTGLGKPNRPALQR